MRLQQYLLHNYLHIPYEEFSHKAMSGLGILTSIKYNTLSDMSDEQKKDLDKSIEIVRKIIEHTKDNVQVNLFILDRNIAPQDFSKTAVNRITNFTRIQKVGNSDSISLSSDQIQKLLCEATLEIDQIVMRQIARYSEQMGYGEDSGQL